MTADVILLLLVSIPALIFMRGPIRACAFAMLASFIMVSGFEWLTGGYAVYGAYVFADLACACWLTLALLHYPPSKPAMLVAIGYWVCCMIHAMKLMGVAPDITTYWWAIRIVNACQILLIGGACVFGGGGKRRFRTGDVLRFGRGGGHALASRARGDDG